MEFTEFAEKVKNGVREFLGGGIQVEVKDVTKNNGVVLTGLTIFKEGECVSPTIYLESFYREWKRGKELGEAVYEIAGIYEKNRVSKKINMDFFLDYQAVRGRVFQKLINYEKNREMLANVPHVRFLDLAVVCYYAYMNDFLGRGSIQIDTSHLDHWGISEEELFADARKNTIEKLGPEIKGMNELIVEMMMDSACSSGDAMEISTILEDNSGEAPMYIMTLKGRFFGAISMYYREWLMDFGRKQGRDFYILPSSIHEIILIPRRGTEQAKDLRRMVKEVNTDHVAADEILSDNVYFFSRFDGNVVLI